MSTLIKIPMPPIKKRSLPSYPLVLPMLKNFAVDACAEFKFHPERKWKADFAIPSRMLLIEIDGGAFSAGRHTRGMGFINDMEKLNAAACLGYRVLRFIPSSKLNRKNPLPPVGLEYLHLRVSLALLHD